ncbi:hypothetical protein ACLOJK_013906 [Asimina triloba]
MVGSSSTKSGHSPIAHCLVTSSPRFGRLLPDRKWHRSWVVGVDADDGDLCTWALHMPSLVFGPQAAGVYQAATLSAQRTNTLDPPTHAFYSIMLSSSQAQEYVVEKGYGQRDQHAKDNTAKPQDKKDETRIYRRELKEKLLSASPASDGGVGMRRIQEIGVWSFSYCEHLATPLGLYNRAYILE